MKNLSKIQGCLLGGAVGDALGYAVEFLSLEEIHRSFGPEGITSYVIHDGKARISDDTQMTLFTANGLLLADTNRRSRIQSVWDCYHDWRQTQFWGGGRGEPARYSWLNAIPELNHPRAPGNTCLSALSQQVGGTPRQPINSSKGCGGVMRVAPVGLYLDVSQLDEIDSLGAAACALTHGHPLGWLPGAALAHMIAMLSQEPGVTIRAAVVDACGMLRKEYRWTRHAETLCRMLEDAVELALQDGPDGENLLKLGEGWVAEETLAVAVYCAVRYANDFRKAVLTAVNHSGDSDSTGAVLGNLLGASLGIEGIPQDLLEELELKEILLETAEDLFVGVPAQPDERWNEKYLRP